MNLVVCKTPQDKIFSYMYKAFISVKADVLNMLLDCNLFNFSSKVVQCTRKAEVSPKLKTEIQSDLHFVYDT